LLLVVFRRAISFDVRCRKLVIFAVYFTMSDAIVASISAPSGATKKGKKRSVGGAGKSKKAASSHPKYRDMIVKAVSTLKDKKGSSRQAILKYIMANYSVGHDLVQVNAHLKMALKRMAKDGTLKQSKGQGAAGSFRIGEKKPGRVVKKAKAPKKPRAKKSEGGYQKDDRGCSWWRSVRSSWCRCS